MHNYMAIFCTNKQTSCQVRHSYITIWKDGLLWGNENLMIWKCSRVARQFGPVLGRFDIFEQVDSFVRLLLPRPTVKQLP